MSFRLSGKLHAAQSCAILYRGIDAEAMTTNHLFLTPDGRFAYLARVIGGAGVYAAEEWDHARAMRFLRQHGEGDIVDEFPDVFRKRAVPAPAKQHRAAPKGNSVEPLLFPLR
jgi:hypothetical protein